MGGVRLARAATSVALSFSLIATSITYAPPPAAAAPREPVRMRELKEQRSVTEKVYLLSDGSFEREIHSTPINYFDEVTGDLEPIDSTLEPTQTPSGRAWKNRGNSFKISLPDVLGDNWVSVETSVSRVAFKPATRFLPEVAIANRAQSQGRSPAPNRRAYDNAFDGAVLDYVSTPYGLKETIELPRFNGANVFSLRHGGRRRGAHPDGRR